MEMPDLRGMTLTEAGRALRALNVKWETDGVSDVITDQMPPSGASLMAGGQMMLYTDDRAAATPDLMAAVPDVRGMSVVEASRALRARGFDMKLVGSGIAVGQRPAAGIYAAKGGKVEVTFALP